MRPVFRCRPLFSIQWKARHDFAADAILRRSEEYDILGMVKVGQMNGGTVMRLSDAIERFIKDMMLEEEAGVELKRNELAEYFGCAPSQINYVLSTRFTLDNGYVTESRRGGGGYIRIVRVARSAAEQMTYLVNERIGERIDEASAVRVILQLMEQQVISRECAGVMRAAISAQALSVPVPDAVKDAQRARILRSMILSVARQNASRG